MFGFPFVSISFSEFRPGDPEQAVHGRPLVSIFGLPLAMDDQLRVS